MAHTDPINEAALDAVMTQIRHAWDGAPDEWMLAVRDPALLTLGRTFQLWLLSKSGVEEAAGHNLDALAIAKPSGSWHHELWALDSVVGSATSKQGPDGEIAIQHVAYLVPGALSIAPAVAELERAQLVGDPLIRLLFAPAYNVYALWLIDEGCLESHLLSAYVPPWGNIREDQIVKSSVLLKELASQDSIDGRDINSLF